MAVDEVPDFTEFRITNHPRRLMGAGVGILVVLAIMVAVRIVLAGPLNDPAHPVTYVALVGGALGALAMAGIMQVTNVHGNLPTTQLLAKHVGGGFGDAGSYVYAGMVVHVVYGALVASLYPRIMQDLLDVGGGLFVAWPMSLVLTQAFAFTLFVLGSVYGLVGMIDLDVDPRNAGYRRFFALHVGYGLTLGVVLGIWWLVK